MPGMGEAVEAEIARFLGGRQGGRPHGPSRLPEIERAIARGRVLDEPITQEIVAEKTHMSVRTLRRHLADAGVAWNDLVNGQTTDMS
jgi:DNA invertase Pin-like site-specific DNA recombinase